MTTLKLTVLWHQNLLDQSPRAVPGVLDTELYQGLFNTARRNQTGPLTVPWPPHEKQRYWELYLEQWRALPAVQAREARFALVPLRTAAPLGLIAQDADTRVGDEGFLHPWGATFVVNLKVSGSWPDLDSLADRMIELRRERRFRPGGDGAEDISLETAATLGLDALRDRAAAAASGPRWEGFSICTLLSTEGEMAEHDPADESTGVARFLQAVTSFSPTWRLDAPRSLAEAKVAGVKDAPASHLVYGIRRGRAIWSPAHFLPPPGKPTCTLGCHHRNLVLASMQTEALGRFVEDTATRLGSGTGLSGEHRAKAKWAVRNLEKVYNGSPDTYRSGSLKAQLEQNELLAPINIVRADLDLPAIPPAEEPAQPSG